jgi:hypothetical protein
MWFMIDLTDLGGLGDVVDQVALARTAEALSGASFEAVRLVDGRHLVLKRLPAAGDWLTRMTGGHGGIRQLWETGVLDRVGGVVDHGVVTVVRSGATDVVVMRDLTDELLPPDRPVSATDVRDMLAGLAALHADWEGCEQAGLCSSEARLGLFAPSQHLSDRGPYPHPRRDMIISGWNTFAEVAAPDVVDAVLSVHADPKPLAARLRDAVAPTLLHGDAKLENLGLSGHRLIAIDWGDLTGFGAAETDVTWFAVQGTWRIDVTPDVLFQVYDARAVRPLDAVALDLSCVGALAQMGFKLAWRSLLAPDEAVRGRASELLAWWIARVAHAIDRIGSM